MKTLNLNSNSSEETMDFAKKLAEFLNIGNTVVLTGDLGCGKTKFTEGVLAHYNLQNEISSPTFNIVNEYTNNKINIYHFDVYRLEDVDEFYAIGGEEYFDKGICLIEWGELILDALPEKYLEILFLKDNSNDNFRTLTLKANGQEYEDILDNFKEAL